MRCSDAEAAPCSGAAADAAWRRPAGKGGPLGSAAPTDSARAGSAVPAAGAGAAAAAPAAVGDGMSEGRLAARVRPAGELVLSGTRLRMDTALTLNL